MANNDAAFPAVAPSSTDPLLQDLTGPQRQAVTCTQGPVLVLAGAGSGKTRVITRRAAYLAATVTRSWHVLAVTFTNKAAGEMKERIAALGVGSGMTVCTFHALCVRILRTHHEPAHLPHNFTIADQSDGRKRIKEAIERAELATANWSPAKVQARISRAKNAMITPSEFSEQADGFLDKTIARIYGVYERLLAEQQVLDFDDLLLKTARLLAGAEQVRDKLSERYRYILIDEYQDTNAAQYRIARLLAQSHRNLFVTGDPDQSIYGWRGADINNILSFETDYPDAVVVRLEQNYRSTKRILSAASALVSANVTRKDKTLWTQNKEGCPVRVVTCEDAGDEAEAIVEDINGQTAGGRVPGECAVFYRVNAMSRAYEEALFKAGIPYRIARGVAFYERKEIKDVLAYLRLVVNPADQVSLERIINTPARGIGKTTVDRLKAYAAAEGCPLYQAVHDGSPPGMTGRAAAKLESFAYLLDSLRPLAQGKARPALERTLSLSGLQAHLTEQEEANPESLENVNELVSAAADFDQDHPQGTLLDWLSYTSLLGDMDMMEGDQGAVTLMTLHAAKGLEFPVVYIVGVEEDLLPFRRPTESVEDEEEERRLFFVGMTRAKERLTLSHVRWRMLRGASTRSGRSTFLDELPADEVEWIGQGAAAKGYRKRKPAGQLPHDVELWEVGTLVRHPTQGLGQIMSMHRGARRTHVDVRFRDGSDRSWVLEFADLERVDYDDIG